MGAGKGKSPYDLLLAGRFERATVEFTRTLAQAPTDSLARLGLAMGHLRLHNYERAATELLTARLSGFGEIPLPLLLATERQLGVALRKAGSPKQLEQSLRSFERVLSVFPTHHQTWWDLGLALESLGERKGAMQAWRRAAYLGTRQASAALEADLSPRSRT